MNFLGYERPNGSVGARNYVLIIPALLSGLVATNIANFVEGTKTIFIPSGQFEGHTNRDRVIADRALIGLGLNPNVAAVIVERDYRWNLDIPGEIARSGKRIEVLDPIEDGGTFERIGKGVQLAREMVREASMMRRQEFDMGHLRLAVKCGGSDATSGIAGNPSTAVQVWPASFECSNTGPIAKSVPLAVRVICWNSCCLRSGPTSLNTVRIACCGSNSRGDPTRKGSNQRSASQVSTLCRTAPRCFPSTGPISFCILQVRPSSELIV